MVKDAVDTNSLHGALAIQREESDEAKTSAQEATTRDSPDAATVKANMDWRSKTMLLLHMMQKTVAKPKTEAEAGVETNTNAEVKAEAGAEAEVKPKTEAEANFEGDPVKVMDPTQNTVDTNSPGESPNELRNKSDKAEVSERESTATDGVTIKTSMD